MLPPPRDATLAERLEQGAHALVDLATALTDAEWQTHPRRRPKIGVVVHPRRHDVRWRSVGAGACPGQADRGVTWDVVHEINARHAAENDTVTKQTALDLLRGNSAAAATAIRAFATRARWCRHGVAQRRCSAHVPVHARGPCGPAQLPPPCQDSGGVEKVGGFNCEQVGGRVTRPQSREEKCMTIVVSPCPAVMSIGSNSAKVRQQAMWASVISPLSAPPFRSSASC